MTTPFSRLDVGQIRSDTELLLSNLNHPEVLDDPAALAAHNAAAKRVKSGFNAAADGLEVVKEELISIKVEVAAAKQRAVERKIDAVEQGVMKMGFGK